MTTLSLNRVTPVVVSCLVLTVGCGSAAPQAVTGAESSASDTVASTEVRATPDESSAVSALEPTSPPTSVASVLGEMIPTGLYVDNRIISYLNDLSMFKLAPTEFGGVVDDVASGRAIVYVSTKFDTAVAGTDLRRYVNDAITWINHSVVDINNVPVTTSVPPTTPVFLVASDLTYQDFHDLGTRVTTEAWTTNAQTRVVGFGPDYITRREIVTVVDLTTADVAAAAAAFGDRVSLVNGSPAVWVDATTPSPTP